MGVDVDAMHIYGYRVEYDDIPDVESRFDDDFNDLADEPDGWEVTILGEKYWCSDLVVGDNAYEYPEDQTYYIGVGLPDVATPDKLMGRCEDKAECVKQMYELVMRKPPTEEPKIHVFARWC